MVKGDKEDFLGKRGLEGRRRGPGRTARRVHVRRTWVPPEGASVVHEGVWVGRVTSARRSAAAGSIVGLAWVPAGWASDGTPFEIQFGRHRATATVALRPFYDPDGEEAPVVSEPVRRSPLRATRTRISAPCRTDEAGWELVAHYGDEAAERARAAATASALADVTARGKIDVRGVARGRLLGAPGTPSPPGSRRTGRSCWAEPGGEEVLLPKMEAAAGPGSMVTDATHLFAGFALAGPRCRTRSLGSRPGTRRRSRRARRPARRSPTSGPSWSGGISTCRSSRSSSRPSSRGTPGRRSSTSSSGRAAARPAGDALRAEGWS